MTQFKFGGLVFDAQIGHGNFCIHNLEVVLFGDLALAVRVVFFRSQQGQIAIQIPFEFVVEEHADRPASRALDTGGFFLIEAVEIGVVFDFVRLTKPW